MVKSRLTACKNLTHDENIPFIFQLTLTPFHSCFMRKISIAFHISKLSMAKFEYSTCTTSLEHHKSYFTYHQNILL